MKNEPMSIATPGTTIQTGQVTPARLMSTNRPMSSAPPTTTRITPRTRPPGVDERGSGAAAGDGLQDGGAPAGGTAPGGTAPGAGAAVEGAGVVHPPVVAPGGGAAAAVGTGGFRGRGCDRGRGEVRGPRCRGGVVGGRVVVGVRAGGPGGIRIGCRQRGGLPRTLILRSERPDARADAHTKNGPAVPRPPARW